MSLESDIHDALAADSAVAALAGTQIYVGHISEPSFPCVQIRSVGGEVYGVLEGEVKGPRDFQIDCYARYEADASALAHACRTALTGNKTAFQGQPLTQAVVLYEEGHAVHRSSFDSRFWY